MLSKNLKFFSFLFVSLLLIVSGFSLLSSFTPTIFSLSSPSSLGGAESSDSTEQNFANDGRLKKFTKKTSSSRLHFPLKYLISALFYGVTKIEVLVGSKTHTYPVHLLARAITRLMLAQGKSLDTVDLNKLRGLPQEQLLNLLHGNGHLKHQIRGKQYSKIDINAKLQLSSGLEEKYFNFFKPYFLKIRILEINKISHFLIPGYNLDLLNLHKIPIVDFQKQTYGNLKTPPLFSKLFNFWKTEFWKLASFGLEAKAALELSINKVWTPELLKIQAASGFNLDSFFFNYKRERLNATSLVNSQTWKVSELSLENLQILKKLKEVGSLSTVRNWITSELDLYRGSIESTLEKLAIAKVKKIKIDGVSYQVDLLLNDVSIGTKTSELTDAAWVQLLVLVKTGITKEQLNIFLAAQQKPSPKIKLLGSKVIESGILDSFLKVIEPSLNSLAKIKITEVEIDETSYSISNLAANLDQEGSAQVNVAKTELLTLYNHNPNAQIVKQKLDAFLATERDNFITNIQSIIRDLNKVGIHYFSASDQNYSWVQLSKSENIGKKYDALSLKAQEELVLLHENGITKEKLTKLYEDKINPFLNNIKFNLQSLAAIKIYKFKISQWSYEVGELIKVLHLEGSKQTGKAKEELFHLFNHDWIVEKLSLPFPKVKEAIETVLKTVRDDFESDIHDILGDFAAANIISVDIDIEEVKQNYSLVELIKSANIGKKYDALLPKAQEEFTKLLVDKIDKKKLIPIYQNKINSFFIIIKPSLQKLATAKITGVEIDGNSYSISNLTANLEIVGSAQVNQAKIELLALYNHDSNGSAVNIKLETALKTIRDDFETDIHDVLVKLKAIKVKKLVIVKGVNEKNYSIEELTKPENIGKKYDSLSNKAKDEFTKLLADKIDDTKLTLIYENKINPFLEDIKPILQEFANSKITKVIIDRKIPPFEIGALTANLDKKGSEQIGKAEKNLLTLLKHDIDAELVPPILKIVKVKEGLKTFLKKIRNDFTTNIHDILAKMKSIKVGKIYIGLGDQQKVYSIVELIKSENIGKKYDFLSDDAKDEFTKLLADKVNKEKLTPIYENKINSFLLGIKPTLQEFAATKIAEVKIDGTTYLIGALTTNLDKEGSVQVGTAKTQLLDLYNHNPAVSVTKDKLAILLVTTKNDFKKSIQNALNDLVEIDIQTVNIDSNNYSIGELLKKDNIDKPYAQMSSGAQIELTRLWIGGINNQKLTSVYKSKTDPFLDAIRFVLKEFKNIDKSKVKIANVDAPFEIDNLIASIDELGSAQVNQAKIELLALYNYDSNGSAVNIKLETALKTIRDDFESDIHDVLVDLKAINVKKLVIGKGVNEENYSIMELTKPENIGKKYDALSPKAQKEFTKLLANKIDGVKLTSIYENKINSFWTDIKPTLQEFATAKILKFTIDGKSYSISHLITNLDKKGSELVGEAKKEFVVLYHWSVLLSTSSFGVLSGVKEEMDIFLKKIRDDFTTSIHNVLVALRAIKVGKIYIDLGDQQKVYSIVELTKSENIGKKYDGLSLKAKIELTKLIANGIDKQKLTKTFQNVEMRNILLAFQKKWDTGQASSYLLWLPVFDIKWVKFSQNKVVPVGALANAIQSMLIAEKFDFTKLSGEVRKQLLSLLNTQGKITEEKTFQDDVWRQIKNHQTWKAIEGPLGQLVLESIRTLLLEIQDLGISKVSHPFFPKGYDLSFLQDNPNWKQISFKNLLQGMKVVVNGTYVEFYSHLFPNKVVFQVPMKDLFAVFSKINITNIIKALERAISIQKGPDTKKILAFQKSWDTGQASSYLLWLPVFDIVKVELSQNQVVPVDALTIAIKTMLAAEKFDFTKLEEEARKQLLSLLNAQGKLRAEKTFQDDVWKQIKNHQKWKAIEGLPGQLVLQSIKTLLLEIQDLGISKVSHPFFPKGYDLSFLQDNPNWKQISFQELLQGMKVVVNGTYVEFYSHLFPNKIVFQIPMKKLVAVFSEITITNIITALKKTISDHPQQEKKLETKNKGLIIGLSVAGSFLVFVILGGFLYWFFKTKK